LLQAVVTLAAEAIGVEVPVALVPGAVAHIAAPGAVPGAAALSAMALRVSPKFWNNASLRCEGSCLSVSGA